MQAIARVLGEWAAAVDFHRLPPTVLHAAKRCIIDVTGVALAGSGEDVPRKIRRYVDDEFGDVRNRSCTIFGSKNGGSANAAALANGAAAHALDFDDTSYQGIVHGSAVIWPAVLAAAEQADACGRDVLAAYVAGAEVEYALGRALGDVLYWKGWWTTGVLGAIGAAAGAARALGLDGHTATNAIRLAACQAIGLRAIFGTAAKPYLCGRAAQAGLEAALCARAGIAGPTEAFEHEFGLVEVLNAGEFEGEALAQLGQRFALVSPGIAFKLFPACSAAQAAIEATQDILTAHDLTGDDVERVVCEVTRFVEMCLTYHQPRSVSEAQFSMPFTVGCVLAFGDFRLDHLNKRTFGDARLVQAMGKVEMVRSDALTESAAERRNHLEGAAVTVFTRDKRRLRVCKGAATGMPANPIPDERLFAKFRRCSSIALPTDEVDRLLERLNGLEGLGSVRELYGGQAQTRQSL